MDFTWQCSQYAAQIVAHQLIFHTIKEKVFLLHYKLKQFIFYTKHISCSSLFQEFSQFWQKFHRQLKSILNRIKNIKITKILCVFIQVNRQMKTNEKKSYQFYFKKLETPTTSKDNKKPQGLQTSPYVKYDTNEKLRLSSNVQSGNKSIQNDRASQTIELQKKAGLYSSGYTPGKLGSSRQHYMSGDMGQKYIPKYITPKSTQLTPEGNKQIQKQKLVQQFTHPEQIAVKTIFANQQQQPHYINTSNRKMRSQSYGLNNQGRPIQRREQKMDSTIIDLESKNVESRNARLTDFLNSTMGKSAVLWNDIHLKASTRSYSALSELGHSITSNNNIQNEGYYAEMERFKQNLKHQEMKTSTLLTVKENDDIVQCERERSVSIPHVDSKVFFNDAPLLNSGKLNIDCKKCDEISRKLAQSQKELKQLYSKRHHTMQQVYKQYSTIKEHQQTEIKLKQQLQSKVQQANQLKVTISSLEKTILLMNGMNEKFSLEIKQLQKLKQDEISQLVNKYEQLLSKQRENVGNYMSCITQLNEKLEEMDGQLDRVERELTEKYQSKIKEVEQAGLKELEMVRNQMEEEMQRVKQSYQSRIRGLEQEQSAKLTALQQLHFMQVGKLTSQLQDAKTYSQQVPFLTEILAKLQSQLFLSQTQKDTLSKQHQSLSNELIKISSTLEAREQELQLLIQNMSKLAREKEQKDQQLEKVLLQLEGQRIRQRETKLPSVHEEEWSSISPSTSSIKQQQVTLTPTVRKDVCVVQSPTKQVINNQQNQHQQHIINQKAFTQLNTKYLQLQAFNTNLKQQLKITSSQLDVNVDHISQMDESLAKYTSQIQSLRQTIINYQSKIQQKDNMINQSKQIIVELNDKVIALKKELYPSDEIIPYPQGMEDEEQKKKHQVEQVQQHEDEHEDNRDVDMIACLTQQLQQKQEQMTELQQQLQQSLDIINLLKNQLTNNKVEQLQLNQIHSQLQHHQQTIQQQQQQSSSRSQKQRNKQTLLNQYFVKIENYYNQILQIFGLELIHHAELQLDNVTYPLLTPIKRDQLVEKSEGQKQIHVEQEREGKQLYNINEGQQTKVENLTMFEHQNAVGTQSTLIQNQQSHQSPQQLPEPLPQAYHPLSQTFHLLSQNQQQMLKIINQWIRKLQRQSLSIRQYKQKCHFLQQQITHLTQENRQLSLQKLEIYDKYEAFVVKLEAENNEQEEKMHMLGEKMVEMEGYVKELEETIHETNRECMIGGLVALEMRKEHSTFGRLIQQSLITDQSSQDIIERNEQKERDVQQFYSQHQLVKVVKDQPLNKPASSKDLSKSQSQLSDKQQELQKQNEEEQVCEETKRQVVDQVRSMDNCLSNKQVIINNY